MWLRFSKSEAGRRPSATKSKVTAQGLKKIAADYAREVEAKSVFPRERVYRALHPTIASGRVRVVTDGGAKIAR